MGYDKELTKQILGDIGPLRFNPKVVKVCCSCKKQDIVRYKGGKKPTADYYCRKCVANRPEVKKKKSEITKKQWENADFRKLVENNSKAIWDDSERRYKMSAIRRDPQNIIRLRANAAKAGAASVKSQSQKGNISKIQITLYSLLDDLGITYVREYQIGPYLFDCMIDLEHKKLLIECNGDYWHNLPKNIIRDKSKTTYLERYHQDCKLQVIWEHEFKNHNKVVELIKYWLGITQIEASDFSFDEIKIERCKAKDYKLLLSKYHYLANAGRGGIAIGGFINDELVCVAVFSPLPRQNITIQEYTPSQTRELSRFCISPQYAKKNFGSWFLSRAIKLLDEKYKCIISYADTTFNHNGALYKATNFQQDGVVKPDYWYISEDGWVMHKKTLYNHAKSLKMTEREFAEKNKYTKVWGKEKLRFIYKR